MLITDGEDHADDPVEAAEAAAEAGVRIFAVGGRDSGRRVDPGKAERTYGVSERQSRQLRQVAPGTRQACNRWRG